CKVGMVEDVEELRVQSHGELFVKRNSLCQIHVGPGKSGTAELVPAAAAKLAVCCAISTDAGASAGIDGGNKSNRIQPLHGARLRGGEVAVAAVWIYSGHKTSKLGAAALYDAIPVR